MLQKNRKRNIYLFLCCLCFYCISGCATYFNKPSHLHVPPETLAQNSRIVLLNSEDSQLKIVARLTYLNEIDNSLYNDREYFFLEIFNDDEEVVLPDSMQITMFQRKPLWIRQINSSDLDDFLVLNNELSQGYLMAFRHARAFELKKIKIELFITNFKKGVFDFSHPVIQTKL